MKDKLRQKFFQQKLLATRHFELLSTLDITISVFNFPPKNRVRNFYTTDGISLDSLFRNVYYDAKNTSRLPSGFNDAFFVEDGYLPGIQQLMFNLCGVSIHKGMTYKDIMSLDAQLNFKVIRHAMKFGVPTRINRDGFDYPEWNELK